MTQTPTEHANAVFDERAARDLAAALVEAAKKAGATWCDAAVSFGSGVGASARDGAVEEVTRDTWRSAGLRVIVDGKLALASSADAPLRADAIAELAAEAVALARASTASPHNAEPHVPLPDGERLAALAAQLGLWDDDTARVSPGILCEQALHMDRVMRGHAGISATKEASVSARRGAFALATSWGFSGSSRGTSASASVSGVLEEGGGKKQVEGSYDARRALSQLDDAETIAKRAAARVLARAGARKIASEELPVLFAPEIARGFLGVVLGTACGDSIAHGRSFLADKRGARILAPGTRIVDDPLLRQGHASRVFDGEGTPCERRVVIDDAGVLQMFFVDHRTGHQLGMPSSGHASRGARGLPSPSPSNILVEGGAGDLESIIRDTPRGLLVTRVMGRALDPVTGDVSRGVAGFLIDGGARTHPVEEVTIVGNALEMLLGVDRVGADADTRGAIQAPTLRIDRMRVAGR